MILVTLYSPNTMYVDQGLFNFRHYMHACLRLAAASPANVSSQTSHRCKYESVEKELGTRPSVTVYALIVCLGTWLKSSKLRLSLAVLIMGCLDNKHFQRLMVSNVSIYTDTGSYLMLLLLCCLLKCMNPWVFEGNKD